MMLRPAIILNHCLWEERCQVLKHCCAVMSVKLPLNFYARTVILNSEYCSTVYCVIDVSFGWAPIFANSSQILATL